jgi:hypothetical protein
MKIFQNKFVQSLPKVILFAITFYNFVWVYWQNLSGCKGVACPLYLDNQFVYFPQFILLISACLLLFKFRFGIIFSIVTSGYYFFTWTWLFVSWLISFKPTIYYFVNEFSSQFHDNNPLTVWESQIVIATAIFSLSIYCLLKELSAKKSKNLS